MDNRRSASLPIMTSTSLGTNDIPSAVTLTSPTTVLKTTQTESTSSQKSRRNKVLRDATEPGALPLRDLPEAQSCASTFIIDRNARALKLASKSDACTLSNPDGANPFKLDKKSPEKICLDSTLEEELFEAYLLDVPGFIERLFLDTIFPLSFESLRLIVMVHHWDKSSNSWKDTDPASATFFNRLSRTLVDAACTFNPDFELPSDRTWVSECDLPLRGVDNDGKRKPGLTLVNNGRDATWTYTLVNVERKPRVSDVGIALTQLAFEAQMMFSTQEQRRFCICVSICDAEVRVYVFDRAGVVGSTNFHITEKPHLLIRLIAGLMLGDSASIGFDSSIRSKKDGTKYVTVGGLEYNLMARLSVSRDLRGRGTVVWRAERAGISYVIKDTWRDALDITSEAEIMRKVAGVEGVVRIVAEETVQHNGEDDSTARIRSMIEYLPDYTHRDWYKCLQVLLHNRIVMTPCAEPLATFKSKKELLLAFIDAIEAHRRLIEKNIMHCDISINNVMLYWPTVPSADLKTDSQVATPTSLTISTPEESSTTPSNPQVIPHRARGILIDLDNAIITHDDKGNKIENPYFCQGTPPFAASEVLMGLRPGEEPQPYHDLESFFYILLYIALHYSGPNNKKRTDVVIDEDGQLKHWLQPGENMQEMGEANYTTMTTTPIHFFRIVTRKCTPYFKDLVLCLEELRQKIFFGEKGQRPAHQVIIDILRKHSQWVSELDGTGSIPMNPLKRTRDREPDEQEDPSPSPKRARITPIISPVP